MPDLVSLLRRELLAARRAGDRAVASTLRSALAALANAETVAAPPAGDVLSEGRAGVAATEVARREVGPGEQRSIVEAEPADLRQAAAIYADLDRDRADAATTGADDLERVLAAARTRP